MEGYVRLRDTRFLSKPNVYTRHLNSASFFLPKVFGSSGHIVLQTQFNWTKMANYLHPPIVVVVVLDVHKQTARAQPMMASERAGNTGK
jgi:hypothetical protein